MIVAKTSLKKIPESCTKCKLSFFHTGRWGSTARRCGLFPERELPYKFVPERKNWCYIKPTWCPLKEVEKI